MTSPVRNEFGVYRYFVGRIYDKVAFGRYWERQRKRAAPTHGRGSGSGTGAPGVRPRYGGRR